MKLLFLEDERYFTGIFGSHWIEANREKIEFSGHRHYKRPTSFFSNYTCVISVQYLWPLCNIIAIKARAAGTNTVLIADGIIDWANCTKNPFVLESKLQLYQPIVHDTFLCPGLLEGKIFCEKKSIPFIPHKLLPKPAIIKPEKMTTTSTLLLTTANTPYFNFSEKVRLQELIKEIISIPDIKIILRIFDKSLLDFKEATHFHNELDKPFEELINEVSAVITTPSSVALTSMLAGKPTCQIIYRDTPILMQTGWILHASCNIRETVESLLLAEKSRLDFQQKIIAQNYANTDWENSFRSTHNDNSDIKHILENSCIRIIESPFNFNFEMPLRRFRQWLRKKFKI